MKLAMEGGGDMMLIVRERALLSFPRRQFFLNRGFLCLNQCT